MVCVSGSLGADRAPGRLRLVRDDRDLAADERVDERRLADVRPAGQRDEARRGSPVHQLRLQGQHLAVVGLVIHAGEMQRAVDDRLAQVLGVLGADHDVAELARAGRRRRPRRRGTRARPSGPSLPRCSALSSAIVSASTNATATCPSSTSRRRERERRRGARSRPRAERRAARRDLDLKHKRAAVGGPQLGRKRSRARRRPRRCAGPGGGARRPRRRSARSPPRRPP